MTDTGDKNSILSNVEIKGTIRFSKELTFDGTLEGDLTSHGGTLVVGGNGKIRGNIQANNVIVKGKVNGNITAEDRCELHGGAELTGDLKTARLVLEAGAMFVGRSEVNPSKMSISAPPASSVSPSLSPKPATPAPVAAATSGGSSGSVKTAASPGQGTISGSKN